MSSVGCGCWIKKLAAGQRARKRSRKLNRLDDTVLFTVADGGIFGRLHLSALPTHFILSGAAASPAAEDGDHLHMQRHD